MVASTSSELGSDRSDSSESFRLPLSSAAGADAGACTCGRGVRGGGGRYSRQERRRGGEEAEYVDQGIDQRIWIEREH